MPLTRRIGNTLFAGLVTMIGNIRITDSASGQRILKREVLEKLYPLPDGLNFTPVMSTRALHEELKMIEVPIRYEEREGESKLSVVRDGLRFLFTILGTADLKASGSVKRFQPEFTVSTHSVVSRTVTPGRFII